MNATDCEKRIKNIKPEIFLNVAIPLSLTFAACDSYINAENKIYRNTRSYAHRSSAAQPFVFIMIANKSQINKIIINKTTHL